MSTSIKFTHFSQELLQTFHPRKFLQHSSLYQIETPTISPTQQNNHSIISYFHANASIVLIVLVCTIISSFGFLCMVKCTVRGSNSESSLNPSAKLPNAGVEKKALNAFPTVTYEAELKLPGLDIACVICLSEFAAGECLRILPKCDHGFHTLCIDTWLSSHSSCPTCRHCLTESDQKTDNCSQAASLPEQGPINIEVN